MGNYPFVNGHNTRAGPDRVDGLPDDSRQNQYMAHATNIAKTRHNNTAMMMASNSGSSGSSSGSFGIGPRLSGLKRGRAWLEERPDAAQLRVEP